MPIPWLLAAAGAAVIGGLCAHSSAKEKNEKAESMAREAQYIYDSARRDLESAKADSENKLLRLGNTKKHVIKSSVKQFVQEFSKTKNILWKNSSGIDELNRFTITPQEVLQMQKMSELYESACASGATGAATGVALALAANGTLTTTLTSAGTALLAGNIAGAAGTAISAVAATPLAAIAAPVVLFTGISASLNADNNLSEAECMQAKAKSAAEEMKTSQILCEAISKRSNMFNELLNNLNDMFTYCTAMTAAVIAKKERKLKIHSFYREDFTPAELDLLRATAALAKAVKTVIDTPMLNSKGQLTDDSAKIYNEAVKELSEGERHIAVANKLSVRPSYPKSLTQEQIQVIDKKYGKVYFPWLLFIAIIICLVVAYLLSIGV